MAEKFCIFCGNKPKDKNMEHVIPQWLIKLTGREKKDVFTAFPENEKHLNFMNFKFPACEACNSKYSKMEAEVKPVVEHILNGKNISGKDISLLMDWFDKIRIGLWLAELYYNKNLRVEVHPHMFIDSRVGHKDRLLTIQKLNMSSDNNKGILFYGTATPWFSFAPCAFTMVINNYHFLNASSDNLLLQRLGFPSVTNPKLVNTTTGKYSADSIPGKNRIINPVVKTYTPNTKSITFYQPIFKDYMQVYNNIYTNDEYVLQHSYDITDGKGGIFVQRDNKAISRYLNPEDNIGLHLKETAFPILESEGLKFQIAIGENMFIPSPNAIFGLEQNKLVLTQLQKHL